MLNTRANVDESVEWSSVRMARGLSLPLVAKPLPTTTLLLAYMSVHILEYELEGLSLSASSDPITWKS